MDPPDNLNFNTPSVLEDVYNYKGEYSKEIIEQIPNLKFVATRSTGFDHIDREYCKSKGILVSNVPSYGSKTVAEFAFALLLTLSRKIFDATRQLKEEGDFSNDEEVAIQALNREFLDKFAPFQ